MIVAGLFESTAVLICSASLCYKLLTVLIWQGDKSLVFKPTSTCLCERRIGEGRTVCKTRNPGLRGQEAVQSGSSPFKSLFYEALSLEIILRTRDRSSSNRPIFVLRSWGAAPKSHIGDGWRLVDCVVRRSFLLSRGAKRPEIHMWTSWPCNIDIAANGCTPTHSLSVPLKMDRKP